MAAVVIKIAAVVNNKVITFNTLGRSEESESRQLPLFNKKLQDGVVKDNIHIYKEKYEGKFHIEFV